MKKSNSSNPRSKALVTLSISFILLTLYFYSNPPQSQLAITVKENAKWSSVNDSEDGGKSTSKILHSDKSLRFKWNLADGFHSPYAGVKTKLSDQPLKGISIVGYDSIHFKIQSSHDDGLRLILKSPDSKRTKADSPTSYFYHRKEVFPQRHKGELNLSLKDFRIPTWWKELHKTTEDFNSAALERLQEVEILNGYSPSQNKQTQIEISEIYFSKANYKAAKVFALLSLIGLFLIGIMFSNRIQLANQQVKTKAQSNIDALKDYKPQAISDGDEQLYSDLISFLKSQYADSELSLQSASDNLKIPSRKLSALLNQKLGLNFKSYLNQLRITESKRLLIESTSNISEISFAVGYNNPSHFNRVFKEIEHCSPKDYRLRNK